MSYTTSLFGCFNELNSCLWGTFCLPCVAAANQNVGIQGHKSVYCTENMCVNPYTTRSELLDAYNLEKHPLMNCLALSFCTPCFVCQDSRELMNRNLMTKGDLCSCSCDESVSTPVGPPRIVLRESAPNSSTPLYR